MEETALLQHPATLPASAGHDSAHAPAPVVSEDHLGVDMTAVSPLFLSLIPANAHRRPHRARATYRSVA